MTMHSPHGLGEKMSLCTDVLQVNSFLLAIVLPQAADDEMLLLPDPCS